jgi:diguanylate cyclase (GGDEF)-like protein
MDRIWKKKESILFFVAIIISILFLVFINFNDDKESVGFYKDYNLEYLENGWVLDLGDSTQHVSVPDEFDVKQGEVLKLFRTLPENIEEGTSICFKTKHTRVCAMVDDEVIYSFGWDDEEIIGNTPGSIWNVIEIKQEHAGKKLTILTKSSYSFESGDVYSVVMGDKSDVLLYVLKESFVKFFLSCIPLVLGVILIVIIPFIRHIVNTKPFLYDGIFLTIVGIWEITESDYMQFLFQNAYTMQILNFIVFGFLPVATVMAFEAMNMIKKHFSGIFIVNIIVYAVYIGLQILNIVDFHESIWIIHAIIVADGVKMFKDSYAYYSNLDKTSFIPAAIAFFSIIVASVIDIYRWYIIPDSGNGAFFRGTMIFFIVCMSISVIYTTLAIQKSNVEKETIINMAYTDTLTGLRNRRCFDDDTEKLVNNKSNFTVVAIDMNGLKKINDELGHKYGDEAIKYLADELKKFEEYGEKSYRMGGDEFHVICTNISLNQIEEICQMINEELSKKEFFPGEPLQMAYGYFRFSATTDKELYRVLAQADKKMYEKKMKMKEERTKLKEV